MIKYLKKDFDKEINNKRILVDFYADWCGPCKMLNQVFEAVQEDIKIDILKVNVDKFPEIAAKYNVFSIPTLYLLDKGNILKNHVGFLNPEELKEFINENR